MNKTTWYHDGHGLVRTAAGRPVALVYGYDTDREKEAQDVVALILAEPEMLEALKFQANWKMRDGTPCACPAGRNEDEPQGKMPTVHATSCEILRAAIAKAEGKEG